MTDNGDGGIRFSQEDQEGAVLRTKYHSLEQDVVGVPVVEIKDSTDSAREEIYQFSFGNFLVSGAFWLGTERLVTEGLGDFLLWVCVIALFSGSLLFYTGYKQSQRRLARLMRYVPPDIRETA